MPLVHLTILSLGNANSKKTIIQFNKQLIFLLFLLKGQNIPQSTNPNPDIIQLYLLWQNRPNVNASAAGNTTLMTH